ncbi:hypothetical protein [Paenirhodobacter enshiensis]|uniref:hypothetical protein n=1 Tax=Paenirhodobacter enshiensis TaxID=1105367 RepID=UPI0035B06DAA
MTRDTTCNGGVMAHDADTTRIIPADGGLIEREAAAQIAERDCDWSAFGKAGIPEWDGGPDGIRDYRLGIRVGRAIAAAIRALPAAQPAQDEDKIGALIRVREIALQAETAPLSMMEIVKRVDMALHEETEIPGWMLEPAAQDVAHPDDLPDDLCVLSYVSATPAAQPLLPGAQVGSEPGIPAAQNGEEVKRLRVQLEHRDKWIDSLKLRAEHAEAERAALKAERDIAARHRDDALSLCREAQMECDKLKAEVERLRKALGEEQDSADEMADVLSECGDCLMFDVDRLQAALDQHDALREAALRAEQKGDA